MWFGCKGTLACLLLGFSIRTMRLEYLVSAPRDALGYEQLISPTGFPKRSLAALLARYTDFIPSKQYQLADWRIRCVRPPHPTRNSHPVYHQTPPRRNASLRACRYTFPTSYLRPTTQRAPQALDDTPSTTAYTSQRYPSA